MTVNTLILDAAPLILQSYASLEKLASNFITTPGVYSEIKDEQARQNLALWGDKLVIRAPKPASMAFISEFAKKTGDYSVLSITDLQILALCYEIHSELDGKDGLRIEPMQIKSNATRKTVIKRSEKNENGRLNGDIERNGEKTENQSESGDRTNDGISGHETGIHEKGNIALEKSAEDTPEIDAGSSSNDVSEAPNGQSETPNDDDGWSTVEKKQRKPRRKQFSKYKNQVKIQVNAQGQNALAAEGELAPKSVEKASEDHPLESEHASTATGDTTTATENTSTATEQTSAVTESTSTATESTSTATERTSTATEHTQSTQLNPQSNTQTPDNDEDFENDDGWITSGNLQEILEKNGGDKTESIEESDIKVAMSTSDFAMQNVALQIGLNLVNPSSGMQIRKVRNYMLRCHGCFKLCGFPKTGTPLQFCPRCGGNTLMRTTVSVSSDGTLQVHLKKNMQWWRRGDRYALPSPHSHKAKQQTGRHGSDPNAILLRADQKEYQQAVKEDQWKRKAHNKMLENWVGSGSADNVMSPFAVSGFNRDISTQSRGVKVGRGRYVNSSRRKR